MNISVHFITSLLLAVILFPFIGFYALWILVGGYLIDADHVLWTAYKLKSFSIKDSYKYHFGRHEKKDYERDILHPFHTVEFWIFMVLSALASYKMNWNFLFYMFSITFIGMLLHLSLDFIFITKKKHFDGRAISWIAWMKRNKH